MTMLLYIYIYTDLFAIDLFLLIFVDMLFQYFNLILSNIFCII